MMRRSGVFAASVVVAFLASLPARAAVITWDGGAGDMKWTTGGVGGNWSGALKPGASDQALFDDTTGAGQGVLTNIVDDDFTIDALTYSMRSGAETSFNQTTQIAAGKTLLATGGLNVAPDDLNMDGHRTVDVTITGGDANSLLQVGNDGTNTANVIVARNPDEPSGRTLTANLDLSGLTTFIANVNAFDLANGVRQANGTITLATDNTIDANTIMIGAASGNNTGTSYLILGQTNTIAANTVTIGGSKSSGRMEFSAGGTLDLGTAGDRVDLVIGRQPVGTSGGATGVVDLSGGTFNAYIDELAIGTKVSGGAGATGTTSGTLTMDAGDVNVNTLTMAVRGTAGTANATLTMNGGTFTVNGAVTDGGGNTTLNIDAGTMTVGNGLSVDTLRVGYDRPAGGTARLEVNGGDVTVGNGTENLYVGWRNAFAHTGPSGSFSGTLDVADADSFTANVNAFRIGYVTGGSGELSPNGTVLLSPDNDITANELTVAHSTTVGLGGLANLLAFGADNTVRANTMVFGGGKGTAQVTVPSGGTLDLASKTGGRANLYVGWQAGGTGGGSSGTLAAADAAVIALLDSLVIGRKVAAATGTTQGTVAIGPGSNIDVNAISMADRNGTGTANATLTMTGGTMTVNNSITDGGGTTLLDVQGGTLNVGGDIIVDTLRVARNGLSATLNMTGTTAQIGSPGNVTDLFVGRRDANTATTFQGTLDLSAVTNFTAYLDEFGVGTIPGGVGSLQGGPRGVVTLATNNTIDARSIVIGDSPSVGLGNFNNRIVLGTTNTIAADTLIVGGNKSSGTIGGSLEFGTGGGTLDLGTAGDRVDVYVGRQTVGTGSGATGHLDMAGGTLNAFIDDLIIGTKPNSAGGTTTGLATFEAGTLDANRIVLGERTDAGSVGVVKGTLNFSGGTIIAGQLLKGTGNGNNANDVAAFNWTGGTLTVGQFGSSAQPFDLLNTGDGTLAPEGTTQLFGNYAQGPNATFEVDLDSTTAFDVLEVIGGVQLDGALAVNLNHAPDWLARYLIVDNDGTDPINGIFAGLDEGTFIFPEFGGTQYNMWITYIGGTGNDVELIYAPEPATLALLGLGLALLGRRRRRR